MKKLVVIIGLMCSLSYTYAQDYKSSLLSRLASRDAIMHTLKDSQKLKALQDQVEDYKALVSILEDDLSEYIRFYTTLTSSDTSVFMSNLFDTSFFSSIPDCLKKHWDVVTRIADLRKRMDEVDATISRVINETSRISPSLQKQVIQETIVADIDEIYNLYVSVSKSDLSTLSVSQMEYFEKLKKRYNNYKKYFD